MQQPEIREIEKIEIALPVRSMMSNGVKLNVINAGEQEVVRMDILFKAGKWRQRQNLQALFANRMLREGSKEYTSAQIAEKLDYYGAWLELSTTMEYAYITLHSLNKYFPQTLAVVESIIKEPTFPEKELTTVVDTNRQQFLVNSGKVDYIAQKSLMESVFGVNHPCGKYAGLDDYSKIDTEILKDFYTRYYHSANCSIYLSGKVTSEIIRLVEDSFGTTPFGNPSHTISFETYPKEKTKLKRVFTEKENAMQSSIKLGAETMTRSHPDYMKMRVLLTLFGGYFGSRLMSNIREDKGYTYGISSGMAFYPQTGVFMVSTEAGNEYVEPIIKEVYHEMDRLQNELVPEQELMMVKNYMLGEMCRDYESPFSIAEAWMFIQTSHLKDDYYQRALEAIRSVNVNELRELACKHLSKEQLIEVVAGKKI